MNRMPRVPRQGGARARRHPGPALRTRALPIVVTAALLIPNAYVIALGVEDFPFTVAPMFAQYVDEDTPLYTFRMEGVRDGVAEPLPLENTAWGELKLMRQFASFAYSPLTETSPFRDPDRATLTPTQFDARLSGFFGPLTDFLRDHGGVVYDTVVLHVDIVDGAGELLETAVVGHYDTATRRYTQTYGGAS
ncbi:hypothetical protein [Microbacterium rhizophilus]|uniref:hypothetical protein n=1 Tax=Microbacterium rhizophilus TaxID=3138934 RepID=UPI0031ECE941